MTREEATKIIVSDRLTAMQECQMFGECEDKDCWECGDNKAFSMAIDALHREDAEEKGYCHRIIPRNVEVVVRCKDCRWYDNRYGDVCHNPRYGDGWANYPPPYVDEDYWCKDGERKGGDAE